MSASKDTKTSRGAGTAAPITYPSDRRAETGDSTVRPFRVEIPEDALVDLRRRVAATRWPEKEPVADQSQGVQLATVQALARKWATDYDWRKVEATLNSLPQFITNIDGLDIHFIHVRSKEPNALPLIVTHGWPGSIIEQLKIVDPLTNPTAHGGSAEEAFDVVIPSMAGYGFSGRPTAPGWGYERIASAWVTLMKRLGYNRFVASGGDWGALVTDHLGVLAPTELLGIHTNMPGAVPVDIDKVAWMGAPPPSGLSDEERGAYEQISDFYAKHTAYAKEMGTRPQTLTGLADSPVGLAAWILDHDPTSYGHLAELFAGQPFGAITQDDVLDNITLYWLTNTGVSSSRLYWELKRGFFETKGVKVPAAVSVFPEELYQAPRSWAEKSYPKLLRYNKLEKGGHFAAWEQPDLWITEVRAAFESLR